MRMRKPEERIQAHVVAQLRLAGVDFAHPPNESKSTPGYRAKLKAMGLSPGIPDLLIFTPPPCGGYVAAALELKSDKGRISTAQREWLDCLASYGWATACTKGLAASLQQLVDWGYLGRSDANGE